MVADTFADDLMRIEGRAYEFDGDALLAAQDFANDHQVKMYVLYDGAGFRVSDQFDDEADIQAEAIPDRA